MSDADTIALWLDDDDLCDSGTASAGCEPTTTGESSSSSSNTDAGTTDTGGATDGGTTTGGPAGR